jgi:O-acetyl-ADP-ribose deacetylase (regulator of RNase III)
MTIMSRIEAKRLLFILIAPFDPIRNFLSVVWLRYNLLRKFGSAKMEDIMLFDDDPRDKRKKRYIEKIRQNKAAALLEPLSEKIEAWRGGETDAADVFKAAGYAARKGEAMISDFKKRPDVILAGIAMDENMYISSLGDIGVEVRRGDITGVFSDAIVSPVTVDGLMSIGAAAAVKEKGGEGIESEAKGKTPIPPGKAISTGPGDLTSEHIIHTAICDADGKITPGSVGAAVSAALELAEKLEAETLAIPGLGAVPDGITPQEAATAVIEAINGHTGENVAKVVLVDIADEVAGAFVKELERLDEE